MNPCKKTIGWADYTWNPLNGCRHNCKYCAAEKANIRFKFIPDWKTPVFFAQRLMEPYKVYKPSRIFVVFMGDLFGDWVDRDWILKVIKVAKFNPQHTFMFLTKNPKRYLEFEFPANSMLGCTLVNEYAHVVHAGFMKTLKIRGNRTFVSIEPIHSPFRKVKFNMFDLVIIGAETGRKPVIPFREWVDSIKHPNIYYKKNIIKYFPDLNNDSYELQRTQTDRK
jgi:protein gp37